MLLLLPPPQHFFFCWSDSDWREWDEFVIMMRELSIEVRGATPGSRCEKPELACVRFGCEFRLLLCVSRSELSQLSLCDSVEMY